MSSHSSDVYVMEDEEGSSVQSPDGLVHSHSTTPVESSAEELYPCRRTACALRTVGTNTENYIEESVSSLLYNGIMELMRAVAGDGFANNLSMKYQQQSKRGPTEEIAIVARNVIKHLGEIATDQSRTSSLPEESYVTTTAMSVPVSTATTTTTTTTTNTNITNTAEANTVPFWLGDLRESISRAEALLHDLGKTKEDRETLDVSKIFSALLSAPTAPTVTTPHSPLPPPSPLLCSSDPPEKINQTEELEAELRKLRERMSEMHLIFAKEGLDSLIPLYDELLELRELRRRTALRDAETTMAYLTTMECSFKQQLFALEKRKRSLDFELTRRSCDVGNTITTLVEDVERLTQLSRDLKPLRSEYQRQVALVDHNYYLSIPSVPGEKRLRTSEGSFKLLFEQQLEKEQQILMLSQELESQKKETTEWRKRYELSVQSTSLVQENVTFNSLLRDVEERLSAEASRKLTLACRLFGWNLLELTDKFIVIERTGFAEEKLTLSFWDLLKDEKSALATSIVLAKKVLKSCTTQREQQVDVQSDEVKDNEGTVDDKGRMDDSEENEAPIKEGKNNELEEMNKTRVESEVCGSDKEEVGVRNPSTDKHQEESMIKETPSLDPGEPAFYSSGLWDE